MFSLESLISKYKKSQETFSSKFNRTFKINANNDLIKQGSKNYDIGLFKAGLNHSYISSEIDYNQIVKSYEHG